MCRFTVSVPNRFISKTTSVSFFLLVLQTDDLISSSQQLQAGGTSCWEREVAESCHPRTSAVGQGAGFLGPALLWGRSLSLLEWLPWCRFQSPSRTPAFPEGCGPQPLLFGDACHAQRSKNALLVFSFRHRTAALRDVAANPLRASFQF